MRAYSRRGRVELGNLWRPRKSRRDQVYKINPDARSRFTALRRQSDAFSRRNLVNVADTMTYQALDCRHIITYFQGTFA